MLELHLHEQKFYYLQHMCCIPDVNRGSEFDNAIIKISRPELETDFLTPPPRRRSPDTEKNVSN